MSELIPIGIHKKNKNNGNGNGLPWTTVNFEFTGSKLFNFSQAVTKIILVKVDNIPLNGDAGAPIQYRLNSPFQLEILDEMIVGEDNWVSVTYNYGEINEDTPGPIAIPTFDSIYKGAIVPTSPAPGGTGVATWSATQAGTYTNFGGVVVNANSLATISRNAAGVFAISQTALDFTDYTLKSQIKPIYSSIALANNNTISGDRLGKVIGINNDGKITDYSWKNGVLDQDLVLYKPLDENLLYYSGSDDYLYTVTDSSDRLLFGVRKDGSFYVAKFASNYILGNALKDSSISFTKIDSDFKIRIPETILLEQGYIYIVTDSQDRILFGVRNDGTFYAPKFSYNLNDLSVTENKLSLAVQAKLNSAGNSYITCKGDSLTGGTGGGVVPFPTILQTLVGAGHPVYNLGVGGENVPTIAARTGAVPAIVTSSFTLPADTTNTVEISSDANVLLKNSLYGAPVKILLQGSPAMVNPCYIQGIECTIAYNSAGGIYTLKRNVADVSTTYIPANSSLNFTSSKIHRNPFIDIIFVGQNGGYNSTDNELVDYIKKMAEFSGCPNYLIIGMHSGTAASRASLELLMFNEFGHRYINWRQYVSNYGLRDAGLTPTTADNAAMAVGSCPPQLLIDSVHLSTAGHTVLANLTYKTAIELGYI
ncbi:hypothetical protein [Flavobacterium fluviatile]|uniref:hypothetical protein n=1 Tax=Flavobacterium fluviatile TaxID=1862387 RepID=UPI0013D69FF5|nr:hypothetical protein [Flavobacterium fluviatile]